jgi:hypothetical protein
MNHPNIPMLFPKNVLALTTPGIIFNTYRLGTKWAYLRPGDELTLGEEDSDFSMTARVVETVSGPLWRLLARRELVTENFAVRMNDPRIETTLIEDLARAYGKMEAALDVRTTYTVVRLLHG